MTTKIGRNEKCPCGSGKKFKCCHGRINTSHEIQLSYVFEDILFGTYPNCDEYGIYLIGILSDKKLDYPFRLFMVPLDDGEWKLKQLDWKLKPQQLDFKELAQTLINKASILVRTTNLWAGEQTPDGAKPVMNQIRVPDEAINSNSISFRSDLLDIPSTQWDELWSRIDSRILADIYFRVHGFSKDEVIRSLDALRIAFPSDWVKARYKAATTTNNPPKMGDHFPPEEKNSWFPAHHLARTALGAICVDPGWNYLVEIGLSIEELSEFSELNRLLKSLSRSPGTQHHLCLAAELFKKGYLTGLEPPTGSGNATNDLSVSINGNNYAVEVKEFSSKNPIRVLIKELDDKSKKTPDHPRNPVIFHVVLREEYSDDILKEQEFVNNLETIEIEIPPNISAIVIGSRFVDSTGGRVKRDIHKIILNPRAIQTSEQDDLKVIFRKNFTNIVYPCYGIGSFFYFDNGKNPKIA